MYGNAMTNQVVGSQLASQQQPTQRLSEVQEQVLRGQKIVDCMTAKLKSLYERLQPVMRTPGSGQAGAETPKPTLVGHAQALSNHNDQLEAMDSGLAEILDRLEL